MEGLNIGQVAQDAGLRSSAIRFYESIGLIPPPRRASGWRQYDAEVLNRLKVIRAARELGFSLKEIRELMKGYPAEIVPSARWRKLAQKKLPEINAQIERANAIKRLLENGISCECIKIDDCFLNDCVPSTGA